MKQERWNDELKALAFSSSFHRSRFIVLLTVG
jgi:hypothetical protein